VGDDQKLRLPSGRIYTYKPGQKEVPERDECSFLIRVLRDQGRGSLGKEWKLVRGNGSLNGGKIERKRHNTIEKEKEFRLSKGRTAMGI